VVNLGEVFYRLLQLTAEPQAEERLAQIKALPIEIVPAREVLVLEAARVKAGAGGRQARVAPSEPWERSTRGQALHGRLPGLDGDAQKHKIPS
jgi:hypothetical protein